ncbi:hypothetical protein GOODEAATRI_034122 [Goodea atripinnis]|uniref:Uncharacterized protein n=1 Tax=Goodea atripinnis TaxID=208336 RepID=A0ABV0P048_9TELE
MLTHVYTYRCVQKGHLLCSIYFTCKHSSRPMMPPSGQKKNITFNHHIRISFIAKFVHTANKESDLVTLCSQVIYFLSTYIYMINKSPSVHGVVFWNSDFQGFNRATAWGKKLSLWRLVLADSAL